MKIALFTWVQSWANIFIRETSLQQRTKRRTNEVAAQDWRTPGPLTPEIGYM